MLTTTYGHAGGAFADAHRKFTDVDVFDWSALTPDSYDAREVERGRRSFVLRALDERRSLLAFSELLAELAEAGAPIDVIGSLTRVVRDEALHVDLCQRIVDNLGGWPDDAPEANWVRSNRKLPLRTRIIKTIVGSLCVGETLSVAMIAGVRKHASDPLVEPVLTRMLADESFHSRFGWWWLDRFAPTLTDAEHRYLDAWVPRMLEGVEKTAKPSAKAIARKHRPSPFGSMSGEERAHAYEVTMTEKILPGLAKAGIAVTQNGSGQ